jgi:hypothetical protein
MGGTKLGATGSGSAPLKTAESTLGERIGMLIRRVKGSEAYKTAEAFVEAKNTLENIGGPVEEARISGQPPSPEQAIAPTPQQQIPQLRQAETVGGLGLKEGEKPLTGAQLQGMQSEAIMALVSELRTQRRLFG